MARPTLLTPTTRKAIVTAVGRGLPLKYAAEAAGVTERCLYKWLAAGRKGGNPECVQLVQALKKARAQGVQARLQQINAAAAKHWQAAAWFLERRYPEHFGSDRREIRELRKQLAALVDRLAALERHADPPPGSPPNPRLAG